MTTTGKPVFVSFASSEIETANAVAAALSARGVDAFVFTKHIGAGQNYASEIVRAIKASGAVVVLLSTDAARSPHVRKEVALAVDHGKRLLPYSLGDFQFAALRDEWTYWLSAVQVEPYSTPDAVADRAATYAVVDKSARFVKVGRKKSYLVEVAKDGSATQRAIRGASGETSPATVQLLDEGSVRIRVGDHDLVAHPGPSAGGLAGIEHGPGGEAPFRVFRVSSKPVPVNDFHHLRWLLLSQWNRPSVLDFPEHIGGRLIRHVLFDDETLSHGSLAFADVTNGVLRIEFNLPAKDNQVEECWVRSRGSGRSLSGPVHTLYPIAD